MRKVIGFLIVVFLLPACDSLLLGDSDEPASLEQNLSTPPMLDDGLEVGSMTDASVDESKLRYLITALQNNNHNIHSILIVKDGKLILESYFGGWHRQRLQSIRSCTKSVVSALVGIAIDQGKLRDEDVKVFDLFPEYHDLRDDQKDLITVRHLLMMSAGLRWDQTSFPDDDPRNDEHQLGESADGFRYTLEKSVASSPGTVFNYSSGNSDLLAGVVHHTTGKYADEFAEEKLFAPLQIKQYGWRKNRNGHPNGGYGVHLYPRDMIKFGKLFLDSGTWNGRQVISKTWIKRSASKSVHVDAVTDYGYQWWVHRWDLPSGDLTTYQAQGNGGQIICVVPEKNAVILLTGSNYGKEGQRAYGYLTSTLLPALK